MPDPYVMTSRGIVRTDLVAALEFDGDGVYVKTTVPIWVSPAEYIAWSSYDPDPATAAEQIADDLWPTAPETEQPRIGFG